MVNAGKPWTELSADEVADVQKKLSEVFSSDEVAKKCSVKVTGQNVNDLSQGTTEKEMGVVVSGNVGRANAGKIDDLTQKFKDALSAVSDVKFDIGATYGVGDKVEAISDVTVLLDNQKEGGKDTITWSHTPGTVALIDFWATWCPPCQAPMAHNQSMLDTNGAKWGDKVQIFGFSIDNSAEPVKAKVNEKGWTSVKQYHVRNGVCKADKQFSFRGIPFCVLLDTEGKVAFMGHPASRKFEDDFQTLLDGKKLSGDGTSPSAGGDDEEGESSGKVIPTAELIEATKAFEEGVAAAKAAAGDAGQGMPRAFLVLVQESAFDPKSGEFKTDFKHYQVFIGPKAKVDKLTEVSKALRDNKTWETVLQARPM